MNDFPRIYITTDALARLNAYYRHQTTGEISGLGHTAIYNGDVLIDKVILLPQESDQSETELEPEALGRWITDLIRAGEEPVDWRLWWHKHPINGWSSVDDDNIDKSLNNGEWMVSIVHTPNGLLARLDLYAPFRVTMDQLSIVELRTQPEGLDEEVKAEIAAKVKHRTRVYSPHEYDYGGYHHGGNWGIGGGTSYIGKGGQLALPESKKNTSTGNTKGIGFTAEEIARAEFFETLADEDWERNFRWDETYRQL